MEYVIIGIIVVSVLTVGVLFFVRGKVSNSSTALDNIESIKEKTDSQIIAVDSGLQEFVVQMEMLPAESVLDEKRLVEITDNKVLAYVNKLVPEFAQVGNAVNNAVQAIQDNGEVLYRAIIPAGAKLTDSKATEGAVRGIYHGADGIQGHANLVAVEMKKGTSVVTNTAAAAMGVASMVVGQYYMTKIDAELGKINNGISKISDFQDNEYRSKVFSLVSHIKKIADF